MRIPIAILLILAPLLCRAAPDPVRHATVYDDGWRAAVRVDDQAGPPQVICDLGFDLPSPGYDVQKPVVTFDREAMRIRIDVRILPKPGDGAWPAVMTPAKASAPLGELDPGRWVVEASCATGVNAPLRRCYVFLLEAS